MAQLKSSEFSTYTHWFFPPTPAHIFNFCFFLLLFFQCIQSMLHLSQHFCPPTPLHLFILFLLILLMCIFITRNSVITFVKDTCNKRQVCLQRLFWRSSNLHSVHNTFFFTHLRRSILCIVGCSSQPLKFVNVIEN